MRRERCQRVFKTPNNFLAQIGTERITHMCDRPGKIVPAEGILNMVAEVLKYTLDGVPTEGILNIVAEVLNCALDIVPTESILNMVAQIIKRTLDIVTKIFSGVLKLIPKLPLDLISRRLIQSRNNVNIDSVFIGHDGTPI